MKNRISFAVVIVIAFFVYSCNNVKKSNDEKFRPQIHYSQTKNWTGEPTGLLYYEGEYHLFHQTNPTQAFFGNIHWGHAVSRDLVHWEQLPTAISPDTNGQIYSGSVIADLNNTSGFGSEKKPPLIAFYTYHDTVSGQKETRSEHSISLAYSLDNGRSWVKHNNSVLKNIKDPVFCNPKVSWNNFSKQWLMTVSIGSAIQIYGSSDCKKWNLLSEFGENIKTEGGWQSSDLFPIKIANGDLTKWVLMVSMNGGPSEGAPAIRYFIGDFNGNEFKLTQTRELWVDYGNDDFAGMIFNNAPDNRKIMVGWMSCWNYANQTPTETWRGSMIFPRDLGLVLEGNYYLLSSTPVKELNKLYGKTDTIGEIKLSGKKKIFNNISFPKTPFVLKLLFDNSNRYAIWGARDYGVHFKTKSGKNLSIGYRAEMNYYYIDRSNLMKNPISEKFEQQTGASYTFSSPITDWNILVDNGSVELFACGNRIVMTALCYPDEAFESFELYSKSGSIKLLKASITEINSDNRK
jgi:fructan beta-fructosidase